MPTAVMKSFADQAEVPVSKVEGYWDWAKEQADKKFKKKGPSYWAYVNALTQRRLGLREADQPVSFKDFLVLESDKYSVQPEGRNDA
jgi:hypothetical protein